METEEFKGPTMQEAVKAVKSKFGSDAVILNTKQEMNPGGVRVFNITAARANKVRVGEIKEKVDYGVGEKTLSKLEAKIDVIGEKIGHLRSFTTLESRVDSLKELMLPVLKKLKYRV